nr:TetR/AcrR family transcriptional regulator [Kibdelosporangium sp. MJ126-NF4]CEL22994.1 Transcriptional regulator, TetR family [Kibdelosporangium sp. MJ126-NF4]CTQ90134.1 Transcriptional regulator, TetR family [Kibdelosporangium sp. MJ126-NF4]
MPVAPGQPLDPAATRARILRTADEAFYARGVNAVGIADLAAAANASKLSIYRHFGSKTGLVQAIADDRSRRTHAWLRAGIAGHEPGLARIRAMFALLGEWFADPAFAGCGVVNATVDTRDEPDGVREVAHRHLAGYLDVLRENLEREVPADRVDTLAGQILLLIEGAILTAALTGDPRQATLASDAATTLVQASATA